MGMVGCWCEPPGAAIGDAALLYNGDRDGCLSLAIKTMILEDGREVLQRLECSGV